MARPYNLNIVNGVATGNVVNGDYTVTTNIGGYDNTTIDPTSVTIDGNTVTHNFTVAANGTLTLHVTEEGTLDGTPVVGATFIRCDSAGATYGAQITTDDDGNAVFSNVPFNDTDAPLIYYKQLTSDGDHNFDNALKNTNLTTTTKTEEIANTIPVLNTFNVTDENYQNLPVDSGQITLS